MENEEKRPPLLNNLNLLYTNLEENKKLLQSFQIFENTYYVMTNTYYENLKKLNSNFLIDEYKSSLINTPMFQLGKVLKDMINVQIDNLKEIIDANNTFKAFKEALSSLDKVLKQEKLNMIKKSIEEHDSLFKKNLFEMYQNLGLKVVDNYISEAYKKHVKGLSEETLENVVMKIETVENVVLNTKEYQRTRLIEVLNEMAGITEQTFNEFNEMKKAIENIIITTLKKNLKKKEEIENLINNNKEESTKESEEKTKEIQKELVNKIINLDKFSYKIQITDQTIFKVEDIKVENENTKKDKEKKKIKKKGDDKKNKNEVLYNKQDKLLLTEEDIFAIYTSLYGYKLQFLNEDDYNLESEKQKLEVKKLTEKMLPNKNENENKNEIKETITDDEEKKLYELLKNKTNLRKFCILLNNFRSRGYFEIEEKYFNIITKIFNNFLTISLDNLLKNDYTEIESLIIILSQTYYIKKNDQKYYLNEEIKKNSIFQNETFWQNILSSDIKKKIDKIEENEKGFREERKQNSIKDNVSIQLTSYANSMKNFIFSKDKILNIIKPFMDTYQLDEDLKNTILEGLNTE